MPVTPPKPDDDKNELYLIAYVAKQACAPYVDLPVCGFIGTRDEVAGKVGDLNYHRTWDDIKNDDKVNGYYTFSKLTLEDAEWEIRKITDKKVEEHFR
jgi:hypothetical protein